MCQSRQNKQGATNTSSKNNNNQKKQSFRCQGQSCVPFVCGWLFRLLIYMLDSLNWHSSCLKLFFSHDSECFEVTPKIVRCGEKFEWKTGFRCRSKDKKATLYELLLNTDFYSNVVDWNEFRSVHFRDMKHRTNTHTHTVLESETEKLFFKMENFYIFQRHFQWDQFT